MVFNLPKKQVTKLLSKAELFCIQNIFNGNIANVIYQIPKILNSHSLEKSGYRSGINNYQ